MTMKRTSTYRLSPPFAACYLRDVQAALRIFPKNLMDFVSIDAARWTSRSLKTTRTLPKRNANAVLTSPRLRNLSTPKKRDAKRSGGLRGSITKSRCLIFGAELCLTAIPSWHRHLLRTEDRQKETISPLYFCSDYLQASYGSPVKHYIYHRSK